MNWTSGPLKRWLSAALVIGLLVAMVLHITRSGGELAAIKGLSVSVLAVTGLLQFASQLFLNASMLLPLRKSVKQLGFWELYIVRSGGLLVGSLVPVAGGIAVRLAYLRRLGVTYADFTWATLLSNVLALFAAGMLTLLATALLWTGGRRPPPAVLLVAVGVFAISLGAVAVFEWIPRFSPPALTRRWPWLSSMPSLRADGPLTMRVFVHAMARHALNFVTFGLIAQSLSRLPGDFLTGGAVYALTSPLRMVNITPGNLGIVEWVVALVGEALTFDLTIGLIAALAFRAIGLVAQGIGMALGSAWIAVAGES